ncbi:MAG: four helix bundle protein, partial [Deltaproteobacteria bacterium]|nr:four helix bundle protein [Deltaproteobacteria bacterium]
MTKQKYDLEERLLEFSVRIIKIVEQLPNTRTGNHVAGQLLKSGTSPYPNHGEAQAAESPKDFVSTKNTLKKIILMDWNQIYNDKGLRWEKIHSM